MAAVDVKKNGFSFIWTIQNFSYCVGDALKSSVFMAYDKLNTRWCLILYPKGISGSHFDTIAVKLILCSKIPSEKEVNFELSICTAMGKYKPDEGQKKMFLCGSEYAINSTIRVKDLHKKESGVETKNDWLTVACRILEVDKKPIALAKCHLRTTIVVERATYVWKIANFLDFNNNKRPIKCSKIFSGLSSFEMNLRTTGGAFAEDKIQIEIKHQQPVQLTWFATCKISLLDIDGKIAYSGRDERGTSQIWNFLFIPMDKLLSRKELYLPNGTLSLRCEFAVSTGAKYNEVENDECEMVNLSSLENCKEEKDPDAPKSLNDNLKCFYAEGKFSDLTVRTPTKDFPVHKTILCARSKVFSAMFESDTKEKLTGVIEIKDIDDDTISKMLLFLYIDTVGEDLEFETSSCLYFAADKYRIEALKKKCSDFLKGNFSVTNVCDVLVLADRHQDQDLKIAAQKFIFETPGEIMESEEWNKLMQNHLKLASETMRSFFRKL